MNADSRAISPFLDEHLYGQMGAQYGVICSRVHDIERQYKGIDVEILSRSDQAYIDEKVKIDNINNPPSAISFELSSIQGDRTRAGWFVKEGIETTHYLIGCVFSGNMDKRTLKKDDIDYITATMVSKVEVKKWLSSIGVAEDALISLDADIRKNPVKYGVFKDEKRTFRIKALKTDKVWITFSAWLSEAPINLVVPKTTLDILHRSRRYVVSRNGFVEIGYPLTNDILAARLAWQEDSISNALGRISAIEGRIGIGQDDGSLPY